MKLLSLLVCLAMVLSGGYMNDDPNAAASTQVTIRDLIVEIQGEEYPLSPTATFSASTENGAALLDFYVFLDDQTLFPVQAKVDDSGAGVLLGNSTTAYTFAPECFDEMMAGEEIPDEVFTMIDSYFGMLRNAMAFDASAHEKYNRAATEAFFALVGEQETTEATFTADGKEQTGQHFTFELNSDEVAEWMDSSYSQMGEDYLALYFDYFNNLSALTGGEEITSFADMMADSGMEMSLSGEYTGNETSGTGTFIYHITVDETALYADAGYTDEEIAEMGIEPIAMDIPMDITVHSPGNVEYEIVVEQDIMKMAIGVAINDSEQTVSMVVSVPESMDMTFDLSILPQEDSSTQVFTSMSFAEEYSAIALATDTVADDAGSITNVSLSYSDEAFSGSAAFAVEVTHDAITDRISAATPQMITSAEELEGTASTSLSLAAMSMMSDVEKLLNDESVAAFVPVVEQLFGYAEMKADVVEETVVSSEPPEDFPEPVIGNLPEGFELYDSYYDGEYGCYSFIYSATDDSGSEIYIDVYNENNADFYTYFTISDGAATPISESVISTYSIEDGGYATAGGAINGHYIDVYIYGSDALTVEDAASIVAGVTFPE